MAKNIVIVESPAKSATIEKYLGKDFKVMASYGHVRDLPSKDGSVDPDNNFEMHYKVAPDSTKTLKAIATEVEKAEALYLATDPDREGEAISWHVLEELKKRVKTFGEKQVHRIEFTEITKSAVLHAVANPRDLAINLIDAQQARRALDYLVGFNLSPVLWRKVRGGLSAGRVQSVALRLICEREDEIDNFVAQEYWSIHGDFNTASNASFTSNLFQLNGEKLEKFSIGDQGAADAAVATLQQATYSIESVKQKETSRNPSAPFITSTLQQEAGRKLGFSARQTMTTAQRLYEAGIITYMRTDSVHLAGEAIAGLRDTIGKMYGKNYVPSSPRQFKSKSQNAQEAHEAIRPTNPSLTPQDFKGEDQQRKLYELIWRRAMACQMASAKLNRTTIIVTSADDAHKFRTSGSVIVFDGFLKVYQIAKEKDEDNILPQVNEAEAADLVKINPDQHFTEPPPRYSEASLVQALEENGIGRPSTYAAIVSTIRDRGYVRLEQRRFFPEDVGRIVNKFLTEHFPKYVDLGFTAEMEEELDEVSRGEREWKPMLAQFWSPFKEQVDDKLANVRKSDVTSEKTGEVCPTCGEGELVIRLGRNGRFKGCSNFPTCRHTEPLEKDAAEAEGAEKPEPEDTGVTCPKCKEGSMVKRASRRGKVFYSCSTYPTCDYAVWDLPLDETCPDCNWPIITLKQRKKGDAKKCPNCDWQDPPMTEGEKARAAAAKERWAKRKKGGAKKTTAKKK